jgi:hypothetical protein
MFFGPNPGGNMVYAEFLVQVLGPLPPQEHIFEAVEDLYLQEVVRKAVQETLDELQVGTPLRVTVSTG